MADPLSKLREYVSQEKEIEENDEQIIFGDIAWPKSAKTNYVSYGTGKDGASKDYYTLECVLFLINNVNVSHPVYVRHAANKKVPVVTRADRKDLLSYLRGDTQTSANIDKSVPLELPIQARRVGVEVEVEVAKRPELEEEQVLKDKERLAARLEGRPDQAITAQQFRPLGDKLSADRIADLRAKRLAKKRKTITNLEDVAAEDVGINKRAFFDVDSDITREIMSRERVWRNRTTVLQSQARCFDKNVLSILSSIKNREEGKRSVPEIVAPAARGLPAKPMQAALGYSRYDQERFARGAELEMNIDTMKTYHGMNKSAAAAAAADMTNKMKMAEGNQTPLQQVSRPISQARPQQKARASKTPIIVIPGVVTSLISMFNAKDLLQDFRFVPSEVKKSQGAKRDIDILIQRKKENGTTVPFRVVDNSATGKFETSDWERVVAVFVQGPAWQFKGWPWHGNPVEIFDKIKAFHLKYDETVLDSNIAGWSVTVLELSKTKRHLDRPLMITFWNTLDKYCLKYKQYLRT